MNHERERVPNKLLLFESDRDFGEMMFFLCESGGHPIEVLPDMDEGLETYLRDMSSYRGIFIEYWRNHERMVRTVQRIREVNPITPIFLFSGFHHKPKEVRSLKELGIDGIITKPFDLENFEAVLQTMPDIEQQRLESFLASLPENAKRE